ncbi:hypothetical protein AC622_01335 [Bacillus sp. FJAT-27916]|uniref:flagellar protein FliT n=1 Tax=Bacillus sp. FJAT-27916 TaxID=1679169 RepID=UPI000671829A|nr:flagellar protein FliT [Bacillus sp. FJAT-27916]KMY43066.1 hypothetical protein AC622_01335 [Bacillus sp. FJAT-27916]
MKALEDYYQVTKEMIEMLEGEEWEKNRGKAIVQLDSSILKREKLQLEIKPPFSDAERALGERCVALNLRLSELMGMKKQEIAAEIKRVKVQKRHNQKYANPYESVMTDGFYYDKRK